jgi:putative transposase
VPYRIDEINTGGYYHVYNRGVNKSNIFTNKRDCNQGLLSMNYYKFEKPPFKLSRFKALTTTEQTRLLSSLMSTEQKLVEILCFVLMPNHFHFLLKQKLENGISIFMRRFSNSYARYFNVSHNWIGHLFQGQFKIVEIESEAQLIHVSRYIHLNPYVSGLAAKDNLEQYLWSSYPDYLSKRLDRVDPTEILNIFKSPLAYKEFTLNHADYARELEFIKHKAIDTE